MTDRHFDLSSDLGNRWTFQPDGETKWTPIAVPHGGFKAAGFNCAAGEYRLALIAPTHAPSERLFIEFDAVNHACEVFAGRDEASLVSIGTHVNPWMPFALPLPKVDAGASLLIVVRVRGRDCFKHERTVSQWNWKGEHEVKQVEQWSMAIGCPWRADIAEGILRGVRLRVSPDVRIDDAFVVTSVAQGTIQTFATIANDREMPVKGVIRQTLSEADGRPRDYARLPDVAFTVDAHSSRRVDLLPSVWGLGTDSYWWPNVPYRAGYRAALHDVQLEVVVDGAVVHRFTQRFGFREFTWRGCHYFLNGVKCNLRGDNQNEANFGPDAYGTHPGFGAPTAECAGWPGAVDTLLRMNFNVMRIHQIPPTPYMLDVCDELGLMIVDETPVRGSEGLEDWVDGWDRMLLAARQLALRDRNHPSVVIWAVANEIWHNRPLALGLQGAAWSADWTRPVIVDGVSDLGPEIINMAHYAGGLGIFPEQGGERRADRPYGETECIWPMDNALQGFAWMATSVRHRRLKGNADLRNYVLNDAFPNYVPGHGKAQQVLEKKVKNINWAQVTSGMEILDDIADPWSHRNIKLMQQCFNPCTACDLQFDTENKSSNAQGEWPITRPKLRAGTIVRTKLAVFNDTFEDDRLCLSVRVVSETMTHFEREIELNVPRGEHVTTPVEFPTPLEPGVIRMQLRVSQNGKTIVEEDAIAFEVEAATV